MSFVTSKYRTAASRIAKIGHRLSFYDFYLIVTARFQPRRELKLRHSNSGWPCRSKPCAKTKILNLYQGD